MNSPTVKHTKTKLRILYLGGNDGTSAHRAQALGRLGHNVDILDPWGFLPSSRLAQKVLNKLVYETDAMTLEHYVRPRLFSAIGDHTYDIVWVNHGELLGPSSIVRLKGLAPRVINYNSDNPFCDLYKRRFSLYRKALPAYDLVVVMREENVTEAYTVGARKVLRVYMSADEVAHAVLPFTPEDNAQWASEVSFIGTWMPERGPLLAKLLWLGVPLKIIGDRWRKAKEWPILKSAWAGPGVQSDNYVKAVQCAKVCIGLLSKGNRDLHTQRSAEIPYIGTVLCAERTSEHEAMYEEGKEAVFWSTTKECADKIFWLLKNPEERLRIAKAGRERCIAKGLLNEVVMKKILDCAIY
jgi:spore maturation protein CgeB